MTGKTKAAAAVGLLAAMLLCLCLIPAGPAGSAGREGQAADSFAVAEETRAARSPSSPMASVQEEAVSGVTVPARKKEAAPLLRPVSRGGYEEGLEVESLDDVDVCPAQKQGGPMAAAVPPPSPQDFKAFYDPSNGRTACAWRPVSAPDLRDYRVYRWKDDDYGGLMNVFYQLSRMDPSVQPYLESLYKKVELMLNSPGLTAAERQAMLDSMETELDTLYSALCSNPGASGLLSQAKGLADRYSVTQTSWTDTATTANQYHWYAVVARNRSGQESPFSHSEIIFAVRDNGSKPGAPSGLSATAYDPGVALSWSRNKETDLAGYNVYRNAGGSWVKLNASLIEVGTEFFFDQGLSGETYGVTAVDVAGRESDRSTATATLAPATVIGAEDAAWSLDGLWKVERYEVGGRIRALLVANDAGSTATHSFTGRRLRVAVSTYWSCGQARLWIDGEPQGIFDLNSSETAWGVSVLTVTGLKSGAHVFTLEALGSGGKGDFHFVNVEYLEAR